MTDTLSRRHGYRCLVGRSWADGRSGPVRIEVWIDPANRAYVTFTGSTGWLDERAAVDQVASWLHHCEMLAHLLNLAADDRQDFDSSFVPRLSVEDQATMIVDCTTASRLARRQYLASWRDRALGGRDPIASIHG